MKVTEKIRKIIFWTIDLIKGGKVYRHYSDIKYINKGSNDKFTKSRVKEYLDRLLSHASATTEFYNGIEPSDICNFPIINKESIRSSYEKFESKIYNNKKNVSVSTSGSTGASFTINQNLNKKRRNIADIIYFSELAGFKLGYRLFYLRFWSMFKKNNNNVQLFLQNLIPIDVFNLSPNTIEKLIDRLLKDTSNKGMLGYTSSFDKICKYLDSKESRMINCNLRFAIGISERLDNATKVAMKKYFNVNMVSRYSNAENGMLAQQPIGEEYFEINEASYFIEVLNFKDDSIVEYGQLGRIVITDLFNYDTPIIRYDTGDIGIMDYIIKNKNTKLVLTKIEGRKMDMIYNTSGEILSTSILLIINKYKEIVERQIIQKEKNEYLFRLKVDKEPFSREKEIITEFKEYLGDDANIKIEYVDEIPLLPSGKQSAIINECTTD